MGASSSSQVEPLAESTLGSSLGSSIESPLGSSLEQSIDLPNEAWCHVIMGLTTPTDIMNYLQANPRHRNLVFDCVQQINRDPAQPKAQIPASYLVHFERIRQVDIPIIVNSQDELEQVALLPHLTNYKILLGPLFVQGYTPEDYQTFLDQVLDFIKTYTSTGKHDLQLRVSRVQDINIGTFTSITRTIRRQSPFEFRYSQGFITVNAIDFKIVNSRRTLSPELIQLLAQTQNLKGYIVKDPIFSDRPQFDDPLANMISTEITNLPVKDFTLKIASMAPYMYIYFILMLGVAPNIIEISQYRYQDDTWIPWMVRKPLYWSVAESFSKLISILNINIQIQKPVRITIPFDLNLIPVLLQYFPNLEAVATFDDRIPGTTTEDKIKQLRLSLDTYPDLIIEVITQDPTLYQTLAQEYDGQLEPLQG
jgi:hypothetical protein